MQEEIQQLLDHDDPQVVASATYLVGKVQERGRVLRFVQETLTQVRLDVSYLVFDLQSTRIERDGYKTRLAKYEKP